MAYPRAYPYETQVPVPSEPRERAMGVYHPRPFSLALPVHPTSRPSITFCRGSVLDSEAGVGRVACLSRAYGLRAAGCPKFRFAPTQGRECPALRIAQMGSDLWTGHGLRRYKATEGLEGSWLDGEDHTWEYFSQAFQHREL